MSVTPTYLPKPTPAQLARELGAVAADLPLFLAAPLFRRWHLHWGATDEEVAASMPGDELVPDAQYHPTRAVTIDAPAEAVWPWLVQVGCLRAGWYADDLLDNLGRPSATRVIPELQDLEVGQWVPMGPGEPNDSTAFRVHSFHPDEWLLWTKPDCTWAWVLHRLPGGRTRLVTRVRPRYEWSRPFYALLGVTLMELGDFAMMRRMLLGIKTRAESQEAPSGSPPVRAARREWPRKVAVRDVALYVDKVGHGDPLVLMHGGPSGDLWTLGGFRPCADQFTLVFYDHRCNGRSVGVPVSSMTWENLTADADALRSYFGFEKWAVLGHSFGGHVALEYALRYPERVSRLVLLDTGADSRWARENAARVVAQRGYGAAKAELVRRWFNGELSPREYFPIFRRIGPAYAAGSGWRMVANELAAGAWRSRIRPEALIFAGRELLKDWSVVDRLGDIHVPTLVLAGREDFVFPPECQHELAEGIPGAWLVLIDAAGHNPEDERPEEVLPVLRRFLTSG